MGTMRLNNFGFVAKKVIFILFLLFKWLIKGSRMTVEEVLTNTSVAGYANRNWSNVRIYIHGVMFRMQKKYLHCEVEDYRPEYGFDYDTG